MDDAHPQLLARDAAIESARVLAPKLDALESMVNYGTHLILRVLSPNAERHIQECVLVAVLCKEVVTMLDGVTVLLRAGCGLAANVPARSLWEADLQMAWILKNDPRQRSLAFWVAHLLRELRRCNSELPDSEYRKRAGTSQAWRPEAEVLAEISQIESAFESARMCHHSGGAKEDAFLGRGARRKFATCNGRAK